MPTYTDLSSGTAGRVPMTVRLKPDDKALFEARCQDAGIEPAIAARQLIEFAITRMKAGADLIDVMHAFKPRPVVRVPAGRAP